MPKRIARRESAAPQQRRKRSPAAVWGVGVAVVAAVTATGLALSVSSTPASSPAAARANTSAAATVSTQAHVQFRGGVPVAYLRTEAGAKAAAQNFVIVSGTTAFLTDSSARHTAVATLAASGSSISTLTEEADSEVRSAADELKGDSAQIVPTDAVARTGVLSVHVLGFDIHRAMVRLWTVAVRGSASGGHAPSSAFESVTVSLVWEADDWKVESSSTASGLVAPTEYQQGTSNTGDFTGFTAGQAQDAFVSGALDTTGYPSPYARSKEGAQEAATSAAMLWGDPRYFADDAWRNQMLAAVAAPLAASALRADGNTTAQQVQKGQGIAADGTTPGGGVLVTGTAVLASRVVAYSNQSASLQLWTASIGGIAGSDNSERPQIAYLLMTVDLSWSGGTWKVLAVSPGDPLVPSPTNSAASSGQDFSQIGGAANAPATA